jgi:hypothetical protein
MYRVGILKKLVKLLSTIENLGKHLIFAFLILISLFGYIASKKRLVLLCFVWVVVISVFFGSILRCTQSGDDPHEDLASFGKVNMKLKA